AMCASPRSTAISASRRISRTRSPSWRARRTARPRRDASRLLLLGRLRLLPRPDRPGPGDRVGALHRIGRDRFVDLAFAAGDAGPCADLQRLVADLAGVRRRARAAEFLPLARKAHPGTGDVFGFLADLDQRGIDLALELRRLADQRRDVVEEQRAAHADLAGVEGRRTNRQGAGQRHGYRRPHGSLPCVFATIPGWIQKARAGIIPPKNTSVVAQKFATSS